MTARPPLLRGAAPASATICLVAAVLSLVAVTSPATFHDWMQEDAWAEWATFAAFVVAAVRWVQRARDVDAPAGIERWVERFALLLVALFCVFVAGEEISWAQRLLGLRPPDIFLEQNFQQELNVHNLLKGKEAAGVKLDSRYLVAIIAIAYGGVVPLAAAVTTRLSATPALSGKLLVRLLQRLLVVKPDPLIAPIFLGVAIVEITYPVELTGEAAELVLGLAFVAAARARVARDAVWPLAATLAGPLLAVAVPALLYGADEDASARARVDLQRLAADAALSDKLLNKGRVHKRLYTATLSGYLEFTRTDDAAAAARSSSDQYFLDPWQNPYWVLWSKKRQQLILYSFGANRKRDLSPDDPLGTGPPDKREGAGDDVVVTLPLQKSTRD